MQQVWRKRWRSTKWLALAAITLVLLISAINKKNQKACRGIRVTFKSDGNNFFIEEKGIEDLLKTRGLVTGQSVATINLRELEATLKKDQWIADAELYFDNKQVLQVIVEEKTPVARIFTAEENSYYIDSACKRLPLSEKLSARIPMFTNFPSGRIRLSVPDSALLVAVKDLAMFIQADDFWKAQVSQVDITPDGFEMVPTVGSHIVVLGNEGNWQQKFDRLFSFYKQVWTKVGFEKYEKIDVRFAGQVVATAKGTRPATVDTNKAQLAYNNLFAGEKKDTAPVMNQVVLKETGTRAKAVSVKKTVETVADAPVKVLAANINKKEKENEKAAKPPKPEQPDAKKEKTKQLTKPAEVKQAIEKDENTDHKKVPKAIMKKPVML